MIANSLRIIRWVRQLRHHDEVVRVSAALRLSEEGVDLVEVLPKLEELLHDPDAQVRKLAGFVVEKFRQRSQAA